MNAASRDEVFKELRKKGIKAIKVVAADGSKANGEIRGIRKRVLVASVIAAAFLAGALVYFLQPKIPGNQTPTDFLTSQTRRQVVGDAVIIEKGIKDGWSDVFELEGERFLASFAIPGVPAGQRNTTEQALQEALAREDVRGKRDEGMEARQIRAMVEGMKIELRQFLAKGGTVAAYGRKLVQRQEQELHYFYIVQKELQNAAQSKMPQKQLQELWEKRNDELRQMGIKLVPMPE